jgi:Amt family ammonium transporter
MMAVFNTNAAASTGAIRWVLIDYVKHGYRFSVTGIREGIIAGLVGTAPATGYASVRCAAAIGFITAIAISPLRNINEGIGVYRCLEWKGWGSLAPDGIDGNGVQSSWEAMCRNC